MLLDGIIPLNQLQAQITGAINPANVQDGRLLLSNPAGAAVVESRAYLGLKLLYPGLVANNNFALKASSFNLSVPAIGGSGFAAGLHGRYLSSPLFQESRAGAVIARQLAGGLSAGIDLAFLTKKYDPGQFDLVDAGDPVFANPNGITAFDPGAGIHWQINSNVAIAASLFHLNEPKVALGDAGITLPKEGLIGLNLAGRFFSVDAGLQHRRGEMLPLFGGEVMATRIGRLRLGYALNHAVIEGQLQLHPRASLFYSFNLPTSELGTVSAGSHEFAFLFTLPSSFVPFYARHKKQPEEPSFALQATPLSQTINSHQTPRYYVSVKQRSGFHQSLRLQVSALPPGTRAELSRQELSGEAPAILIIHAEQPYEPGDYSFIVSATPAPSRAFIKKLFDGNEDHAAQELSLHFRVKPAPRLVASVEALTDHLQITEWRQVVEELPVIPRIFFSPNSIELDSTRYELISGNQAGHVSFRETNLTDSYKTSNLRNLVQAYRNVLNLIGERLRENLQAKITLVGYSPGKPYETNPKEAAKQRATQVQRYLLKTWEIPPEQVQVEIDTDAQQAANSRRGAKFLKPPPRPRHRRDSLRVALWREEMSRVDIIADEKSEAAILAPLVIHKTEMETRPGMLGFVAKNSTIAAGLQAWHLQLIKPEGDTVIVKQGTQALPDTIWHTPAGWQWIAFRDKSSSANGWSHARIRQTNEVDTLRYSVWLQDQLGQEAQSNWQNIYIHRQSQSLNAVEIERIPIILFGFNQHQLTPSSRQFYKKVIQIADKLKSDPQAACVLKGFADAIGDRLYNLHLSIQRAQTIYNGLAKLGVEKSRMQYLGFGKEYPLGENRLPEGRVMNRRVEVYIGYGGYAP